MFRIARESVPFVVVLLAAAIVAGLVFQPLLAAGFLPLLAFVLWFFRDPERATPADPGAIVSPADGKIIRAAAGSISVFMNVFDVHVCRAAIGGVVESVEHCAGRFFSAYKDCASEENERVAIVLVDGSCRVRMTLVAGLIARRIVCKVVEGQRLVAGERVGLIQFGSRVDIDLPADAEISIAPGRRVVAGETRIGRVGAQPSG